MKQRWQQIFSKPGANLALRLVIMVAGVLLIACGIALAKHSCTGTSPISTFPAVCTEIAATFGLGWMTMGMFTFAFNLAFFIAEVALLRSKFNPWQILQIPLFLVLSASVDIWLSIFSNIPLPTYFHQLACLGCSILILGLGIRIQLDADILMTPGDAIVQVISYVAAKPFHKCKIAWDVSLMCGAAALSLFVLHGFVHVREGTIISALLVGNSVKLWTNVLHRAKWLIPPAAKRWMPPLIPQEDALKRMS